MDLQTAPAVHPPLLDSVTEETLRRNVAKVLETLAENRYQDSPPAKLVAVTKTVTPRVINLLKPMEIWDIGENRAQVALPKLPEISPEFHLHWIGRLQTNKVKYIIKDVCMIQSVDHLALAQEIDRQAGKANRRMPVLLQVNIAREPQKGGVREEELLPLLKSCAALPHLQVQGLMAIMPLGAETDTLEALFARMRGLYEMCAAEAVAGTDIRELSMGMSQDYGLAARAGATMVRVGSALFR